MPRTRIQRPNGNGHPPVPRRQPRATNESRIKIHRTLTAAPPDGLAEGELSVNLVKPPQLWVGVDAAVDVSERLKLIGDPALPAGGDPYQVLTRLTAGGAGWAATGERPNDNVSVGSNALFNAATMSGRGNVGIGFEAAFHNNAGIENVGIGSLALANNEDGDHNIALGAHAGAWFGTGPTDALVDVIGSVFIGQQSRALANGSRNEIVIGQAVIGKGSNTITLGNDAVTATYLRGTIYANDQPLVALPAGGAINTVLTKLSATDGDAGWAAVPATTPAGTDGQIQFNDNGSFGGTDNIITGTINVDSGYFIGGVNISSYFGAGGDSVGQLQYRNATGTFAGASGVITDGTNLLVSGNINELKIGLSPGTDSTMYGTQALANNTGWDNCAFGPHTLRFNTTGGSNTAIGSYVLRSCVAGAASNTGVGSACLGALENGSFNFAGGVGTLASLVTGSNNIALGGNTGRQARPGASAVLNDTANEAIYIGHAIRALDVGQTNETVIGHNTIGKGSNTIVLGNDAVTATYLRGTIYVDDVEFAASPAGTDGQIQFNDNGSFGGSPLSVTSDGIDLEGAAGVGYYINGESIWRSMPDPLTVTNNFLINRSGAPAGSIGHQSYGVAALEGLGAVGEGIAFKLTAFGSLPVFFVRRANNNPPSPPPGTPPNPIATPYGTNLFGFRVAGYHSGDDWSGYAGITFVTSEAHTPTAHGTRIDFRPIRNGTTATDQTAMTIWSGVKIGGSGFCTSSVNDLGTGWLNVEGGYAINGVNIGNIFGAGGASGELQYNNNGVLAGAGITTDGSSIAIPGNVHMFGDWTSQGTYTVNRSGVPMVTGSFGTPVFQAQCGAGDHPAIKMIGFGSWPTMDVKRSNGSATAPTNVNNNNNIFQIRVSGWTGDAMTGDWDFTAGGYSAAISFIRWQTRGARIDFETTAPDGSSAVRRLILREGLIVGSETSEWIDQGPGTVNAYSGYYINGVDIQSILSDTRLKEDIHPADLDRCLADVERLPVHRFAWKPNAGPHPDQHATGWLARDVVRVFPKAVTIGDYQAPGEEEVVVDCQRIQMTEAVPTLWGAVQRLSQRVRELEGELATLRH